MKCAYEILWRKNEKYDQIFVLKHIVLRRDPLHDMSIRAAEQIVCIIGVCFLCLALYFLMVAIERVLVALFSNNQKEQELEKKP